MAFADNLFKDAPESDRELSAMLSIREMLEQEMSEAFRQGAEGWLGDVFAFLNWGFELEDIQTPVKIFHGSADEIIFPAMGRAIAHRLPRGHFQAFPSEGHFCLFRHWVRILDSLA
jgi:pimeloyl-ACP methyl ester carboxylesterase